MSSVPAHIGFAFTIAAALSACAPGGGSIRPQIFSFDYEVQTLTDPKARIDALKAGSPVSDYMSQSPCRFRANFTPPTHPSATISDNPGDIGFNIAVTAAAPVNTFDAEPDEDETEEVEPEEETTNCPRINGFNITIGGPSERLDVGGTTSKTQFDVTIGGVAYSTGLGWFEATLGSFDPGPRYAGGVFRFLAKGPGSAIVIGEGAYAVD